jgi:hypothetical protein
MLYTTHRLVRKLLVVLLLMGSWLSGEVSAQDLEPRRWSHLPTGLNMLGAGYSYTNANVYFNPVFRINDTVADINSIAVSAIRTFDLAGKSARFSVLLPYVSGRWQGEIDDEQQVIHRRGVGDPRLRFSVNLYGAPALKGDEYRQYRASHKNNTVVGASIAVTLPFGQYYSKGLINIGHNRMTFRPQLGLVHTHGPWSFELTGSAFIFTNNESFVDNAVLKQKTMYAAQIHAIYTFDSGLWTSLSTGYGSGGRIMLDKQKTDFEVDNWLWAASIGLPVGHSQSQSLKLVWLSGRTQNDVGRDSDNLVLSWSIRWAE